MKVHQVIRNPILTEKSHALASEGKYVFKVSKESTKREIARAVELFYKNVKVAKVAVLKSPGKTVRWRRKKGRPVEGRRPAVKKAIVTLSKGKIDLFEKK
ncbi:MAG: 50S ribosomal protein L23 [Patescibacteria group bacterium]|nr:MAG: 50S ribosomal protein L23 [Patescibacteria group bacterium]